MQKPSTSASVAKGRASSLLYRSQPRLTRRIASSASLSLVNSSMSAPAMNPESFPERTTSPRGVCAQLVEDAVELGHHFGREDIGRGAFLVERQPDDVVAIGLQLPV